jgi:hypothetical protein
MMALLVLLVVLTLLGGPMALILSLIALSRLNSLERKLEKLQRQRETLPRPAETPPPGPIEVEPPQAARPVTDLSARAWLYYAPF